MGDVAHHASLGGDHELAASASLLAAERCLKLFAYSEAAALAERGVQHCQSLDPQHANSVAVGAAARLGTGWGDKRPAPHSSKLKFSRVWLKRQRLGPERG